jgi:hypothetical protein
MLEYLLSTQNFNFGEKDVSYKQPGAGSIEGHRPAGLYDSVISFR